LLAIHQQRAKLAIKLAPTECYPNYFVSIRILRQHTSAPCSIVIRPCTTGICTCPCSTTVIGATRSRRVAPMP